MSSKTVLVAILVLFLVLGGFSVLGEQSSTVTTKQYLEPFYRASMSNGVNYTSNLVFNPSDGVSRVKSAILTVDAYLTPTVTINVWIDGVACNTPSYTVSTTFAGAGKGTLSFDCTNRVTTTKNYTITIRPTGANTGAVTAWADITYDDAPAGEVKVHGTEYRSGETATLWLQLTDNQNEPENDASCYIDIYAPSTANTTRPEIIKSAPMLQLGGSEGVYYYEIVTPNTTGVYMDIASCSYPHSSAYVYQIDGLETNAPIKSNTTGTWSGNDLFIDGYSDWIYTQCSSGGGKVCEATYDYNTSVHISNSTINNLTNADVFFMGETSAVATMSTFAYYWNNNTWVTLSNNLTFTGASNVPLGVGDFVSNNIRFNQSSDIIRNGTIRIRIRATSSNNFILYPNWLNIQLRSGTGTVQELKGSSEMHINNWFSTIENDSTTQIMILSQINATTNRTLVVVDYLRLDTTSILGNQTIMLSAINSLNASLYNVNVSLAAQISALSAQIGQNTTAILIELRSINTSLQTAILSIPPTNLTSVLGNISLLIESVGGNATFTNNLLLSLNATINARLDLINNDLLEINTTTQAMRSLLLRMNTTLEGVAYNVSVVRYELYLAELNISEAITQLYQLDASIGGNFSVTNAYILSVNQTVVTLQSSINNVLSSINIMNQTVNTIRSNITTVISNQATILTYLSNITGQVTQIQSDVDFLQTSVDDVQNDVNSIQSDINSIQTQLDGIAYNVSHLNVSVNLTGIQDMLSSLLGNCSLVVNNLNTIGLNVLSLQTNFSTLFLNEENESVTLLGYYNNLLYVISTVNVSIGDITFNATGINDSITGLSVLITQPRPVEPSVLVLLLLGVLLLAMIFFHAPYFIALVGAYAMFAGIFVVGTLGLLFGLFITGVGLLLIAIGIGQSL